MILAISHDTTSIVVSTGANGSFDADDLLDYTFDTLYVSNTSDLNFSIDLSSQNTTYIGIAGHNLGTLGCSISIINHNNTDISSFTPLDDRPIMLEIPPRTGGASNFIRIKIVKQNASDAAIVSHVATGLTTDFTSVTTSGQIITRDYQAGYPRIPMNRARKSKAILNDAAGPTATLIKTISQRVKLNIANVATNFAQVELVEYQTFWTENAFFIQNDDDFTQSYMAMQFIPNAPSTHSSTRELVNLSYSFIAHNGL